MNIRPNMNSNSLGLATLLATVLLAACAANPADKSAAAGSPDEMVCTREYPTGSNLPVSRCRSRAQIDEEKATAAESLRRAQPGGPAGKPLSGS